jgi:hypothetical protein
LRSAEYATIKLERFLTSRNAIAGGGFCRRRDARAVQNLVPTAALVASRRALTYTEISFAGTVFGAVLLTLSTEKARAGTENVTAQNKAANAVSLVMIFLPARVLDWANAVAVIAKAASTRRQSSSSVARDA